jgi:cobalt-zinc-cadmium resistance protein CzcA
MRFNELITGVRSDIAIKVFGDDLEYINKKALEIKNLISDVPGASDVILEKTSGLPQIKVNYNRKKIAYYDIDISVLNAYLTAAFGGEIVGVIFDGEKRFDLVMRFNSNNRTDIADIKQLRVPVAEGVQVPFSELADIKYAEGPAKISRDNTHRRVVVSVNVQDRDLKSVVEDIQQKVDDNITLLPGNYIEYGGQFENLENATNRLLLAVPIAMLLIFIFLHFAFKSFKDAIMIFSAIPLATVGGVIFLWLRGMPFSVSAGVGFIALFGIAVLNGIVLIEHLKELQHSGMTNIHELIMIGTKNRLRPIMLTAAAAAMGFLPMAFSTGAGAEVQRPLATVVIGGLVTSTLLTTIALPLLFEIFYNVKGIKLFPLRFVRSKSLMIILLLLIPSFASLAQPKDELNLNEVVEIALQNNKELTAYALKVDESNVLKKTSFSPDKTNFNYGTDQNNIAENGYPLAVWGVEQSFNFPTQYVAERRLKKLDVLMAETEFEIQKNELIKQVSQSYYNYQILFVKQELFQTLDSLYADLLTTMEIRADKGDVSRLEVLNISAKKTQVLARLNELNIDMQTAFNTLSTLMNYHEDFSINKEIVYLPPVTFIPDTLPIFQFLTYQNDYTNALVKIEKNNMLPDFTINYFLGSNRFTNSKFYHGFQFGVSIPLFYGSYKAKIKAAQISDNAQTLFSESAVSFINNKLSILINEQNKYKSLIDNYQSSGKLLHDEIARIAIKSFETGEIDFYQFVSSFEVASQLEIEFLEYVLKYNIVITEILYYSK